MFDYLIYNDQNCEIEFSDFSALSDLLQSSQSKFIICDKIVYDLYSLINKELCTFILEVDENKKSFNTYIEIINCLINLQADKDLVIIAIGGGVITDLAGYVASTFKRGVRLIFVPTTLLAMVDAAIGGKNAVNVGLVKNVVGAFKLPEKILIIPEFLKTLSNDEIINGLAEVIKIAIVYDAQLFAEIEKLELFDNNFPEQIKKIINLAINTKMEIVNQDFNDVGIRKILNFGHTLGHAIEIENNIKHGFAVAYGMYFSLLLSNKYGIISPNSFDRATKLLTRFNLNNNPSTDLVKIFELLLQDKKISSGSITEILIKEIGEFELKQITLENYKAILYDMR